MNQSEANAQQPQRQSQVQERVEGLRGDLTVLHNSIGELIERLSSVLRPSIPSDVEKAQDRAELVSLAYAVEDFRGFCRVCNPDN